MSTDTDDLDSGIEDLEREAREAAAHEAGLSSIPVQEKIESVADHIVADELLDKKTHFPRWSQTQTYTKMTGLIDFIHCLEDMDKPPEDEEGKPIGTEPRGFAWFSWDEFLKTDYRLRQSVKGETRHLLKDITKITEGGGPAKKRGLFRR